MEESPLSSSRVKRLKMTQLNEQSEGDPEEEDNREAEKGWQWRGESLWWGEENKFLHFPSFCCDIKKGIKLGEDNLDGSFLSRSKNSPYRWSTFILKIPTMAWKHQFVIIFFRPPPGYTWPGKVKAYVQYNWWFYVLFAGLCELDCERSEPTWDAGAQQPWQADHSEVGRSTNPNPNFATWHLLIKDALARRGGGSRGSGCPRRCKVNSLISSSTISFRRGKGWFAGISSSGGTISRRKSWSSTQTTNFLCQRFVSRLGDCPSDKLWNDWNKNWHQAYLGPADPPPLSLLGSRGHHRVHCQVSQLIFRNL